MKLASTLGALLFAALLCLSGPLRASEEQPKEWTWKDAQGNVRSRADLDAILAQHKLWVDSACKSGTRADLRHTGLRGAKLAGAFLIGADLNGAFLSSVDLNDADLSLADLSGANLYGAHLSYAFLSGANL